MSSFVHLFHFGITLKLNTMIKLQWYCIRYNFILISQWNQSPLDYLFFGQMEIHLPCMNYFKHLIKRKNIWALKFQEKNFDFGLDMKILTIMPYNIFIKYTNWVVIHFCGSERINFCVSIWYEWFCCTCGDWNGANND